MVRSAAATDGTTMVDKWVCGPAVHAGSHGVFFLVCGPGRDHTGFFLSSRPRALTMDDTNNAVGESPTNIWIVHLASYFVDMFVNMFVDFGFFS